MKVAKFGGSSLANAQQIKKAVDIILADPERKIIVVSAPGKRTDDDSKVTDILISLAESIIQNKGHDKYIIKLMSRFEEIIKELHLDISLVNTFEDDIRERVNQYTGNDFIFMDLMKASGEDFSAKILTEYLNSIGEDASYINPMEAGLFLSSEYGNARVLPESFDNLKQLNDKPGILILPGFFGYSSKGDIVTFSRGGSDITGSILAAALDVSVYENFTDVDFVYAANPKIISQPVAIDEITYREMRELSYAGFSILHEETLEPVYKKGIPVNIKNTNNPTVKGTLILKERVTSEHPIVGIAADGGFCSLYISKYMMNREIGFGKMVLQILEEEKISFEHMPSGIDNMSVIMKEKFLDIDKEMRVLQRIKTELNAEEVAVERGLAMIMVVGEGMMKTVGVAARAAGALAKANINIEMINQGSSEVSMMFGILEKDTSVAVESLYKEFFT